MKASDKQSINKKIVSVLKKRYTGAVPKQELPILETILYAICLDESSAQQADTAYERIFSEFHDLNEIRVSSLGEVEFIFDGMKDPEWRAMRIRTVLQYVFEKRFTYEFEALRRKALELAGKHLTRFKVLTPFVRIYTLQVAVGAHLVPVDERMLRTAIWLGLVEPKTKVEAAANALKSIVRKADAPLFCHLLRKLANDPKVEKEFSPRKIEAAKAEFDLTSVIERLDDLFKNAGRRKKIVTKKNKQAITKKTPKKNNSAKTAVRKKSKRTTKTKRSVTVRKKK